MKDMPSFADSLINHMQSRKKHNYINIASALILLSLDFIFVGFLLTPILVTWDPLFDLEIEYVGIGERVNTISGNNIANITTAISTGNVASGGQGMLEYNITPYVQLLILAPFLTAGYLLYLGISGVLFYNSWNKKYQIFLKEKKALDDEIDNEL